MFNLVQKFKQLTFNNARQQHLLEDLAALLEDGATLNMALGLLSKQSRNNIELEVIRHMQIKMSEGESFALGLLGWYSNNLIEILRAGESGGALPDAMRMAASTVQQKNEALNTVLQSLLYPSLVFIAGLAMLVYISQTVFSNFAAIKPIAEWPANGQAAVQLAQFIEQWWWLIVVIFFIALYSTKRLLELYNGDFRKYIDLLPPFSIYRQMTAARLMETLGLLISNGILLKQALWLIQKSAQPYLKTHLLMMEYRLSGGRDNIADVLDTGLIDANDLARLRVIALGRGFESALIRQGRRAIDQSIQRMKFTGKVLGGLLMTLSAGLLGFIFYAIYSIGLSFSSI